MKKQALVRSYSMSTQSNQQQTIQQNGQQTNNMFILSQFKAKYDELKNQFQQKKKEAQALQYEKKKLEIQVLNNNVEFYQKQLTRLRAENQKFQLDNEQNKHKYLLAQNSKKDLEATAKTRQEELKKILKQLQKQKITVVQLRYQLGEKDKSLLTVVNQFQNSNSDIASRYDEVTAKLSKTQDQIRANQNMIIQLKREKQLAIKQKENIMQQLNKQKDKNELKQYRLKNKLQDLQEQRKEEIKKYKEQINKLTLVQKQLQKRLISQQYFVNQKQKSLQQIRNIRTIQDQLQRVQLKTINLQKLVKQKQQIILILQTKIKNIVDKSLLQQSQQKYKQLLKKHNKQELEYYQKINKLEKQLQLTKLQSKTIDHKSNFQTQLKTQIQQNQKLKLQLSKKIDQIFNLKTKIQDQQIKLSILQHQLDISQKKLKAGEKNGKIQFDIQRQNLKNQIGTLTRKLQSTQARLNSKLKQVKDKDSFITNVLIGRSKPQQVPLIISQLQRIFQGDYPFKLTQALAKIKQLQQVISYGNK